MPQPGPTETPELVHMDLLIEQVGCITETLDLEEIAGQRLCVIQFVALAVRSLAPRRR